MGGERGGKAVWLRRSYPAALGGQLGAPRQAGLSGERCCGGRTLAGQSTWPGWATQHRSAPLATPAAGTASLSPAQCTIPQDMIVRMPVVQAAPPSFPLRPCPPPTQPSLAAVSPGHGVMQRARRVAAGPGGAPTSPASQAPQC